MGIFDRFFGKKKKLPTNNKEFWDWFVANEKKFFQAIKKQENIERDFFDHLTLVVFQQKVQSCE